MANLVLLIRLYMYLDLFNFDQSDRFLAGGVQKLEENARGVNLTDFSDTFEGITHLED